jgi:hypothetical protein
MAKYFAAHYGVLDNLSWMASKGFNEAGLVVPDGQNPSPASIHGAGIPIATLNIFNDGSSAASQIGAAGGPYAGYYQSIASNGWNMIAGEGCGGDVIGTVQNYLPYVNYGGDQANNMYAGPWNHPNTGKGHLDYIETYTAGDCVNNVGGVSGCINAAKSAGSKHLGILIGDWCLGTDAGTYINIVDSNGCDTICFWGGYGQPSSRMQGLADQLISHYGAAKWGGGAAASGGAAGATAAAAPVMHPVVHCPCRHIWIGFAKSKDLSNFSEHLEFWVKIVGKAGYVDDGNQWLPRPYTGLLQLWTRNEEKLWKLKDFWPDANGDFALWVGSDTAEKRHYGVKFADDAAYLGYPNWRVVMEY